MKTVVCKEPFQQFEELHGMKIRLDDNELDVEIKEDSNVAPATFKHRKPQSFRCTYYQDGMQCPKVFGSYRKRDEHFAKHNQSASLTWYFCLDSNKCVQLLYFFFVLDLSTRILFHLLLCL